MLPCGQQNAVRLDTGPSHRRRIRRNVKRSRTRKASRLRLRGALLVAQILHASHCGGNGWPGLCRFYSKGCCCCRWWCRKSHEVRSLCVTLAHLNGAQGDDSEFVEPVPGQTKVRTAVAYYLSATISPTRIGHRAAAPLCERCVKVIATICCRVNVSRSMLATYSCATRIVLIITYEMNTLIAFALDDGDRHIRKRRFDSKSITETRVALAQVRTSVCVRCSGSGVFPLVRSGGSGPERFGRCATAIERRLIQRAAAVAFNEVEYCTIRTANNTQKHTHTRSRRPAHPTLVRAHAQRTVSLSASATSS